MGGASPTSGPIVATPAAPVVPNTQATPAYPAEASNVSPLANAMVGMAASKAPNVAIKGISQMIPSKNPIRAFKGIMGRRIF